MILSIQFRTILKIISHYFQNQSSPLKKTKDLRIRSPRIGQNNAEIGLTGSSMPMVLLYTSTAGASTGAGRPSRTGGSSGAPVNAAAQPQGVRIGTTFKTFSPSPGANWRAGIRVA